MVDREVLSKLVEVFKDFGDQDARILLLGLEGAGKSSILHSLKLKEKIKIIQKIGFIVEEVAPIRNVTFSSWDVGGQEKVIKLKRQYYKGSDALVFVVDSTDVAKIDKAKVELLEILNDETMYRGVPLMVFVNKQDLPTAMKAPEVVEKMNLEEITSSPWFVQEMVAKTGNGVCEGITVLADMVKAFLETKPGKQ